MAKRLITLMAALLVVGFVIAGCGDDSSNDSSDTAAQTVTDTVTDDEVVTDTDVDTETETVTDETDTDVTSDDNGGAAVPANVEQAVEACQKNVDASSQLSADTKSDLKEICEKAGSGNEEDVRKAAAEVCKKVVEDTLPSGTPGREQALSACDNAR